jgi:hypothetical protein
MRTSLLLLGALPLLACTSDPASRLAVQPELAPKFDLTWDDDLHERAGRLIVDFSTERWVETLTVGTETVPPGSALQIVVTSPFSPGKEVFLHDPATEDSTYIAFESYTTEPKPNFTGFAVVPEYSEAAGGTWLHLVVGTRPEEGVRILVRPAP